MVVDESNIWTKRLGKIFFFKYFPQIFYFIAFIFIYLFIWPLRDPHIYIFSFMKIFIFFHFSLKKKSLLVHKENWIRNLFF